MAKVQTDHFAGELGASLEGILYNWKCFYPLCLVFYPVYKQFCFEGLIPYLYNNACRIFNNPIKDPYV